jgi:hypothetical protein
MLAQGLPGAHRRAAGLRQPLYPAAPRSSETEMIRTVTPAIFGESSQFVGAADRYQLQQLQELRRGCVRLQDFWLRVGERSLPFCGAAAPFRVFILSPPLLDRDDIGRSEPAIALPFPRCFPVLLGEDQLAPEGIFIPKREILAHDWCLSSSMIYY